MFFFVLIFFVQKKCDTIIVTSKYMIKNIFNLPHQFDVLYCKLLPRWLHCVSFKFLLNNRRNCIGYLVSVVRWCSLLQKLPQQMISTFYVSVRLSQQIFFLGAVSSMSNHAGIFHSIHLQAVFKFFDYYTRLHTCRTSFKIFWTFRLRNVIWKSRTWCAVLVSDFYKQYLTILFSDDCSNTWQCRIFFFEGSLRSTTISYNFDKRYSFLIYIAFLYGEFSLAFCRSSILSHYFAMHHWHVVDNWNMSVMPQMEHLEQKSVSFILEYPIPKALHQL